MSVRGPLEQLKALADKLRTKSGIECGTAKFDLGHDGVRVEYVRGKDFVRYFHQHPELVDFIDSGSTKSLDEKIAELGFRFIKNGLLLRTERKYKIPKPGKPRVVKWPKTLEKVPIEKEIIWEPNSFYVWQYERPTSPWLYFWATLMAVAIIACCLLPIAPYKVKIVVFYLSLTLLSIILGAVSIRFVIWLVIWLATGREFWILPNALSDEVGIKDAFTPLISFEVAKGLKSHWLVRIFFMVLIALGVWFLQMHKPATEDVKDSFRRAHDDILDFLSLHDPGREKLSNAESPDPTTQENSQPKKEEL